MTGAEILTAILADAFETGRRTEAITWANAAQGAIWNSEEWTFKQTKDATVTVTANSNDVTTVATDFGTALSLFNSGGDALEQIPEYRVFASRYLGTNNAVTGTPEAFCAVNGVIYVGPKAATTDAGYLLVYEPHPTPIADNSTQCALPPESHLAVVFGGKAIGFLLTNAERAAQMNAAKAEIVAGLHRDYLVASRGAMVQQPAFRPGS